MILSVSLFGCTTASTQAQKPAQESVYDRVIRSGKLRCGYVVYNPGCIKDPNSGKLSGIGIEAIELVAEKLGLKVEWTEEVGWGTMIEGLETNRYDIVATPIWTNANRAKIVDFSHSLFYSPIYAYAKFGKKVPSKTDLSWINDPAQKVATIDGETAEIIAREDFPKATKVSLPQLSDLSQLLLSVSSGKADVTFAEPAVVVDFLKHNEGVVAPLAVEHPLRVFPNSWMFRRGQEELKSMLNTVLDQLHNSGAIDKIVTKYEPSAGTLYRVGLPYQKPVLTSKAK